MLLIHILWFIFQKKSLVHITHETEIIFFNSIVPRNFRILFVNIFQSTVINDN